jgi:hypothetical protein
MNQPQIHGWVLRQPRLLSKPKKATPSSARQPHAQTHIEDWPPTRLSCALDDRRGTRVRDLRVSLIITAAVAPSPPPRSFAGFAPASPQTSLQLDSAFRGGALLGGQRKAYLASLRYHKLQTLLADWFVPFITRPQLKLYARMRSYPCGR